MGKHKNANCSLDQHHRFAPFALKKKRERKKYWLSAKRQRAAVNVRCSRPEQIDVEKKN